MSTLISWREVFPNRSGSDSLAQGDIEFFSQHEYNRSFQAQMSDGLAGPDTVVTLAQLAGVCPVLGNQYVAFDGAIDSISFAKSIRAKQDGAPWIWIVDVEYTSDVDTRNPTGNPLLAPAKVHYGRKSRQVVLVECNNGDAVVNSAGFPFDPPWMVEESWRSLQVVKNFAAYDDATYSTFEDTINETAWTFQGRIYAPGEVLCRTITANNEFKRGIEYWQTTFELELRQGWGPNAWAAIVLDRGGQHLEPGTTKGWDHNRLFGRPVGSLELLDGAGNILPRPISVTNRPVFLAFHFYEQTEFAGLPIP